MPIKIRVPINLNGSVTDKGHLRKIFSFSVALPIWFVKRLLHGWTPIVKLVCSFRLLVFVSII